MRKLRKGESYALLRAIDIAPFKTRRSPLRYAHRDDEAKSGVMQWPQQVAYCTKLVTLIISFICVLFSDAQAQSVGERAAKRLEEVTPLQIGDTIPGHLWTEAISILSAETGQVTYSDLSAYRDKLLILDFWNIWCGTCITAIGHGNEIIRSIENDVALFPITTQSAASITAFAHKNEIIGNTKLPLIVGAHRLAAYFPHKLVPHVVMIKDGKVFHIGSLESMKKEALNAAIINNKSYFTYFKNDFHTEEALINRTDYTHTKAYRLLSRYRDDASPTQGIEVDSMAGIQRIFYNNHSLFELYQSVFNLRAFPLNRIDLRHSGISLNKFAYHSEMGDKLTWLTNNALSYEAKLPLSTPIEVIKKNILADLRSFLGIEAKLEEKYVEVLKIKTKEILQQEKQRKEETVEVFYVIDAYNSRLHTVPFIQDESITRKMHIPYVDLALLTAEELLELLRASRYEVYSAKQKITILTINRI